MSSWEEREARELRRQKAASRLGSQVRVELDPDSSKSYSLPPSVEFTPRNVRGSEEDDQGRLLSVLDWRDECRSIT